MTCESGAGTWLGQICGRKDIAPPAASSYEEAFPGCLIAPRKASGLIDNSKKARYGQRDNSGFHGQFKDSPRSKSGPGQKRVVVLARSRWGIGRRSVEAGVARRSADHGDRIG